jgi:hypothetical protein
MDMPFTLGGQSRLCSSAWFDDDDDDDDEEQLVAEHWSVR